MTDGEVLSEKHKGMRGLTVVKGGNSRFKGLDSLLVCGRKAKSSRATTSLATHTRQKNPHTSVNKPHACRAGHIYILFHNSQTITQVICSNKSVSESVMNH